MAATPELRISLNPVTAVAESERQVLANAFASYLTAVLDLPVRLVDLVDYDAQIAALRDGAVDAAVMGTYAFAIAQAEARAEALAVSAEIGSDEVTTYQSVVITRADSRIRRLEDLRGATVGFVDPSSTSGFLLPRRLLRDAGIDPDADITSRLLHSHEVVGPAVLAGEVAAGALHRRSLARFLETDATIAGRLRTIAMSPPLPTGPLAVRHGLPHELRQRLLGALLRLHEAAPEAARIVLRPGVRWRPSSNRDVTLKTVAALAGVSYGTVWRAVNGQARIAPETQARIMELVRDLNYQPNPAAVGLVADRSNLIGLLTPDVADPRVADYLIGVRRALAGLPWRVVVCPTGHDRADESHFLDLLDAGRFDGLLLTGWHHDMPGVAALAAAGRSMVILGRATGSEPVPVVAPDAEAALVLALVHLRELGHRRVALLTPPTAGIETCRLPEPFESSIDLVVHAVDDATSAAADVGSTILAVPERPTAVICGTEWIALGILQAAHDLGMRVPATVSVVALSESRLAAAVAPPLTTAATPAELLGEWAARLLIGRLPGGSTQVQPMLAPTPMLIRRASTAAAQHVASARAEASGSGIEGWGDRPR